LSAMKVLLDECVTRYPKRDFTGHEVLTVEEAGFKGLKNGQLLQAASGQYDVLVTVDQNLQYQQNLTSSGVAIIVLKAQRSTYPMLKPLMSQVLGTLEEIKSGEIIVVG
jgi:predicted nuclease of predicted toxin-antitoxin system